ncbi:MAG: lasso peptide biosynthesis B2 protein [Gammaproteobacteria bacterium]
MRPYHLAPRVYVCAAEEGAILLNLQNDAYTGLEGIQSRALSLVVEDWPSHADDRDISIDDARALAEVLVQQGLLADSNGPAETRPPLVLATVESELIPWEEMEARHAGVFTVLWFVMSLLTVLFVLRFRAFPDVVDRLRMRKQSAVKAGKAFDLDTARNLVSAFYHIRAFFYGQKGRCLLDSLTLMEFLAHYGSYPTWVIGVQINPFGSHNWVQYEAYVLNGTPAYVRSYTPILAV